MQPPSNFTKYKGDAMREMWIVLADDGFRYAVAADGTIYRIQHNGWRKIK
jgi:hypothetical protein